ncbi:MAG: hypothetical protein ACR2OM_16135, partial [Aestuariivirgaceae bacterium]
VGIDPLFAAKAFVCGRFSQRHAVFPDNRKIQRLCLGHFAAKGNLLKTAEVARITVPAPGAWHGNCN